MKKSIFVTTAFEGIHSWPDAPDPVDFLRSRHRHMFHVRLEISVGHSDRELEFILVKRALESWIKESNPSEFYLSCESIAERIIEWVNYTWPGRSVTCEVSEDAENGAVVRS